MKFSDMSQSKYLQKEDVHGKVIATIVKVERENVAPKDQPPEYKLVMSFDELAKVLILNKTNMDCLREAFGDETANCIGQQVILYVDPTVMFANKRVGGIRLRAKRPGPGKAGGGINGPAAKTSGLGDINADLNEMEDDIPI